MELERTVSQLFVQKYPHLDGIEVGFCKRKSSLGLSRCWSWMSILSPSWIVSRLATSLPAAEAIHYITECLQSMYNVTSKF
jgi:hypothetical protein